MTKVVVTGSAGQLGTLLVEKLCALPSVERVVAVDLRRTEARSRKVEHVAMDVRSPELATVFDGAAAVFHLAFLVFGSAPREVMQDVNVAGSRNVFACAARAKVSQIVYASSVAAYGVAHGHPVPVVEGTPRRLVADFIYSANKFEVEAELDEFEPAHPEMAIARMRVGILVGRKMEHALGRAMQHRLLLVSSDAPWPVVWDEDVADAFVLAFEKRARGAFNVAADDPEPPGTLAKKAGMSVVPMPRRLRDGLANALDALTFLVRPAIDPAWMRNADVAIVPSSEKAKRDLGWSPKQKTAADVVSHYALVAPLASGLRAGALRGAISASRALKRRLTWST